MSLLEKIRAAFKKADKEIEKKATSRTETFAYTKIPESLEEFQQQVGGDLKDPMAVAALTVVALNMYGKNKEAGIAALNYLKGPAPLTPYEIQFLDERFRNYAYVAASYFLGSSPENNYTPTVPYTVKIRETPYSKPEENYRMLYLTSSGADAERPVKLRLKPSTSQWFLSEQYLMVDIRTPKELDPWA